MNGAKKTYPNIRGRIIYRIIYPINLPEVLANIKQDEVSYQYRNKSFKFVICIND